MDYITKEKGNTIIFCPHFNEKIDYKLLSNYEKVIFTDYKLTNSLFDNYSNRCIQNNYYNYFLGYLV